MKKYKFQGFTALVFISVLTYSQNGLRIDSLISKANSLYNQDSALFYVNKAYDMALQTGNNSILANAAYYKSTYLIGKKRYDEAFEILQNILKNKTTLPEQTLGNVYYNIGSIYYLKEANDQAITNYLLAINYYKETKYKRGLAKANLQIGVIYEKLHKMDVANYFYGTSISYSSNKSAHSQKNVFHISFAEKIKLCKEMLRSINQVENPNLAAIVYYNLAMAYYGNKDYSEAIKSMNKSTELKEKIGFKENLDVNYAIIGKSYLNIRGFKNAVVYLSEAKNMTIKRHLKNELSGLLIEAYSKMGHYKTALELSNELSKAKDSVNALNESEKIAKITAQFETEKQAKEILVLKHENQQKELLIVQKESKMWKWTLFALLASIVSVFFGRKLLRYSKRIKKVELEKRELEKKVDKIAVILNNKSKVYLDTLKYIKSDGNYLEFVTSDKTIIDRNKLKDILNDLPPNFVRVHRSYVINKNFIEALNSSSLILTPHVEIPLSRTFKSNITQ